PCLLKGSRGGCKARVGAPAPFRSWNSLAPQPVTHSFRGGKGRAGGLEHAGKCKVCPAAGAQTDQPVGERKPLAPDAVDHRGVAQESARAMLTSPSSAWVTCRRSCTPGEARAWLSS